MEGEGDEIKSKQDSKRDRTLQKTFNEIIDSKYYFRNNLAPV